MIDDRAEIIRSLRNLRIANGITLAEMTRRTGYSERHISLIERGGYLPKIQTLQDMAGVFGYKVSMALTYNSGEPVVSPKQGRLSIGKARHRKNGVHQYTHEHWFSVGDEMHAFINRKRRELDKTHEVAFRNSEVIRHIIQEAMDREKQG